MYNFPKIIIEYFITDAYAAAIALLPPKQQQQIGRIYILYYTVNATSVHIPRAQSP